MRTRKGYEPRTSQTRYGQAVDNPPLWLDDTARLRTILGDHGAEWRAAVNEVQKVQAVHTDRWQQYFRDQDEPGFATKADIKAIWVMLTCIGAVSLSVFGWLLSKVH